MDSSNSNPARRISRPTHRLTAPSREAGNQSARQAALERVRRRRRRRRIVNILMVLAIAAAIGLFFWAEQRRRHAINELQAKETELEQVAGGPRLTEEEAEKIRREVGEHIALPDDPKPSVATIVNVENLRKTSNFYEQAKNGDFVVVTDKRAILYDPDLKKIIDVVSVKIIEPSPAPSTASSPAVQGVQATPTPSPPPAEILPSAEPLEEEQAAASPGLVTPQP